MASFDDAKKAAAELQKQGRAILIVNLVGYAGDDQFAEHPPSCRVTATVRDPDSNKMIQEKHCDIVNTSPPYTCPFEIRVETVIKSLWRFVPWTSPSKQELAVDVHAEPINGYEESYDPDDSIRNLKLGPGSTEHKNIALKPKRQPPSTNMPPSDPPLAPKPKQSLKL